MDKIALKAPGTVNGDHMRLIMPGLVRFREVLSEHVCKMGKHCAQMLCRLIAFSALNTPQEWDAAMLQL